MILTQAIRFGLIGILATLVHMAVGSGLIHLGVTALIANVGAFCVAFVVSFSGHYRYSFAGHSASVTGALKRFMVVALLGFLLNEAILAVLTLGDLARPTPALLISTSFAAASTFVLSRVWAFRSD